MKNKQTVVVLYFLLYCIKLTYSDALHKMDRKITKKMIWLYKNALFAYAKRLYLLNGTLFIYLFVCLFVCLFVSKMPTRCVFEIQPIMNGEWIRILVNIY